jgi:protein MAK16
MQSDQVIWDIINHGHCSFKSKVARERTFCQNPYNVTGLCIRSACPLANSRYATIREESGILYLYMKTAERAHTPKHLWEKIKLPANYTKALELISKELEFFPKYLVHRNKQRLTKIHQMIIRMRKLKLQARPEIVTTSARVEKREAKREAKALKAAVLERSIENELLERLKHVSEGEIYNYPEREYSTALNKSVKSFEKENGEEEDEELEEGLEEELEEEDEDVEDYNIEYVEGIDGEDDDEDGVDEAGLLVLYEKAQAARVKRKADKSGGSDNSGGSKRSKAKVEVEYEYEEAPKNKNQKQEVVYNF